MDPQNSGGSSNGDGGGKVNLRSPSVNVLRHQLKGVRSEVGSMLTFRDAPAFEMVMRLNQRHKGKLVAAILKRDETSVIPERTPVTGKAKGEVHGSVNGASSGSGESRFVFVPEAYSAFLEEEMQKWMDPFRGHREVNKHKRQHMDGDSHSSDGGDVEDYSGDDVIDYSSTSST